MNKNCIGSKFDDFLEEEGLLQESGTVAIKRVIAYALEQKMLSEKDYSKPTCKRFRYFKKCYFKNS